MPHRPPPSRLQSSQGLRLPASAPTARPTNPPFVTTSTVTRLSIDTGPLPDLRFMPISMPVVVCERRHGHGHGHSKHHRR